MNFFKIGTLSALFFTAYAGFVDNSGWEDTPEECGKTRFFGKELKTIDQQKAATGQFPWVARIGHLVINAKQITFHCGGSLVSSHYVISSAKCGAAAEVARFGDYNLEDEVDCDECDNECAPPYQEVRINKRILAEKCQINKTNDISVLQLKRKVELNEFVQPICIPLPSGGRSSGNNNNKMFLPGWYAGTTKPISSTETALRDGSKTGRTSEASSDMLYLNPPIVSPAECNKVYARSIEKSQWCVGYPKSAKTPCVRDFGGGLVAHETVNKNEVAYLAAISTRDLAACDDEENLPAVYTDVRMFADWISDTIKEAAATRGEDDNEPDIWGTDYDTSNGTLVGKNDTLSAGNDTMIAANATNVE